jgi:4-diphosphocytidyl-2-C-methyl-D-erythritol kinase
MVIKGEAFAKINRELRVGGCRPDGFHEIRSRFTTVDFSDDIEVEEARDLELVGSGLPVPGGDENLAVRAARLLAARLGVAPGARIRLHKRIPLGAGLGGGSSDAGVALLLLSRLWKSSLALEELSEIAAAIGSDVPFFLVGGEADVLGRGERVVPREDAPDQEITLLIPPFAVPTAAVYASYSRRTGGAHRLSERLEIETTGNFLGPNDLASAVQEIKGAMSVYLDSARKAGAEAEITGSGSTVVLRGITPEAERELVNRHPGSIVKRTRTLGRKEYRSRTSG